MKHDDRNTKEMIETSLPKSFILFREHSSYINKTVANRNQKKTIITNIQIVCQNYVKTTGKKYYVVDNL